METFTLFQNGEWDVEATLTFARMTEDKPMLMTVSVVVSTCHRLSLPLHMFLCRYGVGLGQKSV